MLDKLYYIAMALPFVLAALHICFAYMKFKRGERLLTNLLCFLWIIGLLLFILTGFIFEYKWLTIAILYICTQHYMILILFSMPPPPQLPPPHIRYNPFEGIPENFLNFCLQKQNIINEDTERLLSSSRNDAEIKYALFTIFFGLIIILDSIFFTNYLYPQYEPSKTLYLYLILLNFYVCFSIYCLGCGWLEHYAKEYTNNIHNLVCQEIIAFWGNNWKYSRIQKYNYIWKIFGNWVSLLIDNANEQITGIYKNNDFVLHNKITRIYKYHLLPTTFLEHKLISIRIDKELDGELLISKFAPNTKLESTGITLEHDYKIFCSNKNLQSSHLVGEDFGNKLNQIAELFNVYEIEALFYNEQLNIKICRPYKDAFDVDYGYLMDASILFKRVQSVFRTIEILGF